MTLRLRRLALAAAAPLLAIVVAGAAAPKAKAPPNAPAPAQPAPPPSSKPQLRLFPDSQLVVGDRIGVEVVGRGPDVVLIPGLASSRETWRRTAERLRGRYRLHLVQVMGFAGAPARANGSGPVVAPTVAAIDAYIVKAGLKRPAVVGHSLGGLMGLELALDHPADVGKVFVVDSLAFYSELVGGPNVTADAARPFAAGLSQKMRTETAAQYAQAAPKLAAGMVTAPAERSRLVGWMLASDRPAVATAMSEDMTTDLRPRLPALRVPLTVMYEAALAPLMRGDYAPVKDATLVAARPGALHFLMDDDPRGFDAALDAFLAK